MARKKAEGSDHEHLTKQDVREIVRATMREVVVPNGCHTCDRCGAIVPDGYECRKCEKKTPPAPPPVKKDPPPAPPPVKKDPPPDDQDPEDESFL